MSSVSAPELTRTAASKGTSVPAHARQVAQLKAWLASPPATCTQHSRGGVVGQASPGKFTSHQEPPVPFPHSCHIPQGAWCPKEGLKAGTETKQFHGTKACLFTFSALLKQVDSIWRAAAELPSQESHCTSATERLETKLLKQASRFFGLLSL